jgi:L-proline amide hydrolase
MDSPSPAREGFVPFRGHRTWYREVGEWSRSGKQPLLVLHGGPGGPHDYLEPLEQLALAGRRVVFYDQLGCGASDHPHDPALWTVELFRAEVAAVREALGLSACHILGQSWGAMLALEHTLERPDGVTSLVLADALVSEPEWSAAAAALRAALPVEVQQTLDRHLAAGTTGSPEFAEAIMVFYRRHVCRLDPWPECLLRAFVKMEKEPEVYETMWGPSEFHCSGTLRGADLTPRLGDIMAPCLVLGGRFDESTPSMQERLHRALTDAEWVVFERSSHMPHLEETDAFLRVVGGFLDRVEDGAPAA